MHRDLRLCYQNWTSPLDAAKLLDLFVSRPLFTEPHQTFIKQTMIECETGKDRLAQPLEATDAIIGHKTGTGDLNARWQLIGTNDIGFVFLPDEERYTIAVFAKDSEPGSNCGNHCGYIPDRISVYPKRLACKGLPFHIRADPL